MTAAAAVVWVAVAVLLALIAVCIGVLIFRVFAVRDDRHKRPGERRHAEADDRFLSD